jgi:hypothetical protein
MPELPDRPDVGQLRRQARDLHRAAAAGEPEAVDRIRRVSDRIALSAAQLAVAREYGYPSWPALRAEAERRRAALATAASPSGGTETASPAAWFDQRRSFGGGAAIQTAEGVLSPYVLTAGPGYAQLDCSAAFSPQAPSKGPRRGPGRKNIPRVGDLTATDDKGAGYALRLRSGSFHFARNGDAPRRGGVSLCVDPVPPAGTSWIELHAENGSASRLMPSPRAAVRVTGPVPVPASVAAERKLEELAYWLLELRHSEPSGDLSRQCAAAVARSAELQQSGELGGATGLPDQLARLCVCLADQHLAADRPVRWSRFVDALTQADGPLLHLDLTAAVPRLGDLQVQLDHLVSASDSWRLYLRAKPTWWGYSTDGHRKWELLSVRADDDQGGRYVPAFGGSSAERGHEELVLNFIPRIDPLARRLRLTFSGETEEAAAELDIASATA